MTERIQSRQNAHVREARRLARDAAERRARGALVAEGVRLVEEALRAEMPFREALHSPRLEKTERGSALLRRLEQADVPLIETEDEVLESVSEVEASQGILAVLGWPPLADAFPPGSLVVMPATLQDPGNLGTIARTAEAAGVAGLRLLPGTADWTSPKAVRSSMGSLFRLPVRVAPLATHLEETRRAGARIVAADAEGETPYDEIDWRGGILLILGAEAEGVPPDLLGSADARVRIPLHAGVESLNVAAAAAVLVFEAARRRR